MNKVIAQGLVKVEQCELHDCVQNENVYMLGKKYDRLMTMCCRLQGFASARGWLGSVTGAITDYQERTLLFQAAGIADARIHIIADIQAGEQMVEFNPAILRRKDDPPFNHILQFARRSYLTSIDFVGGRGANQLALVK